MSDNLEKLWQLLHSKHIMGVRFQRNKMIGGCKVNFYSPEVKLAIDVDHLLQLGAMRSLKDLDKETALKNKGVNVLHFKQAELNDDLDAVVVKVSDEVRRLLTSVSSMSQKKKSKSLVASVSAILQNNNVKCNASRQIESQLELPL